MLKKTIVSVTAIVVIAAITLFAAEKAKEKKAAENPEQQAKAVQQPALGKVEGPMQRENLLDQLIKAYKEDDKKAMGEIIQKMEQRRNKMQEFQKFEKWHRQSHRRMAMRQAGPGWNRGGPASTRQTQVGQGGGRMGPGWGMDGRGPVGGGCCCGGRGNWGPPEAGLRPQPPCGGFGPQQGWAPGPGQDRPSPPCRQQAEPQSWDMPPAGPPPFVRPPEQNWWGRK